MFQTVMFISEAPNSASHWLLGTARLPPRSIRIAVSTRIAVISTMLRKVSTGSSLSAMRKSGQLVPHTSVSAASSASTLGDTRFIARVDQAWWASGACR